MALPASYTEATLKAFMHTEAADIGTVLGWTVVAGSYDEPLNDALVGYGLDDVTTVTGRANLGKLRAHARAAVWASAVKTLGAWVNHSADGRSFSDGDLQARAKENYQLAISELIRLDTSAYAVTVTRAYDRHSAFASIADEDRVL